MTLTEQFRLLDKVKRMVSGCSTSKQYDMAGKYCYLAVDLELKDYIRTEIYSQSWVAMQIGMTLWQKELKEKFGIE